MRQHCPVLHSDWKRPSHRRDHWFATGHARSRPNQTPVTLTAGKPFAMISRLISQARNPLPMAHQANNATPSTDDH
jgi:hypothetical protein